MGWKLAPQVSYCVTDGEVIFLDRMRDRYIALPAEHATVWTAWAQGRCDAPAPLLARLCEEALLEPGDDSAPPPPFQIPVPAASLPAARSGRAIDVLRAAACRKRVMRRLRERGFVEATRRTGASAEACPADIDIRAARFLAARRLLPQPHHCLHDSLALLEYLGGHGAPACLVFGVTALPFRAHCWVQTEFRLLNDEADRVRRFTPIAAI